MKALFIVLAVCFVILFINYTSQSRTLKNIIKQRNTVGDKLNQLSSLTQANVNVVTSASTPVTNPEA